MKGYKNENCTGPCSADSWAKRFLFNFSFFYYIAISMFHYSKVSQQSVLLTTLTFSGYLIHIADLKGPIKLAMPCRFLTR